MPSLRPASPSAAAGPPEAAASPASRGTPRPAARLAFTPSQAAALKAARTFLGGQGDAFSLTGAAGTGKTTLVETLVALARSGGRAVYLVAPTARAARVLRHRSGHVATTVHSHLYTVEPLKGRPGFRLHRKPNTDTAPTLLVVDEASMVPSRPTTDGDLFHSGSSMLDDLVAHVRAGPRGSQVLFVGDACQLPPVGESASIALDTEALAERFRLTTAHASLNEIVRQSGDSPILGAAHTLRAVLDEARSGDDGSIDLPRLDLPRLRGFNAHARAYLDASDGGADPEGAVLLAYANRSTQMFNRDVRALRGLSGDLAAGDLVVLEADAWRTGDAAGTPSLRRGEPYRVREVGVRVEVAAGLRFVRAVVERATSDGSSPDPSHEALVCLDALTSDKGLSADEDLAIYGERRAKNPAFRLSGHPKDDRYVGALRVRYGYALTVHKAQGGEWGTVIVDPWVHPSRVGTREHVRWLYTAVTRARERCFLR